MTRNERIIELVKGGMSYGLVADEVGVTRNVVAGVCRRAGLRSNPEHVARNKRSGRVDEAIRLRGKGLTWKEIAYRLGYRSEAGPAVSTYCRKRAARA